MTNKERATLTWFPFFPIDKNFPDWAFFFLKNFFSFFFSPPSTASLPTPPAPPPTSHPQLTCKGSQLEKSLKKKAKKEAANALDHPKRAWEKNVWGERGFRKLRAGQAPPAPGCAALREEGGTGGPEPAFPNPHVQCREGKVQKQPQGTKARFYQFNRTGHSINPARSGTGRGSSWLHRGRSSLPAAAPRQGLPPPPRPLRYWGRRCRCDRGRTRPELKEAPSRRRCCRALPGCSVKALRQKKKSAIYRKKKL